MRAQFMADQRGSIQGGAACGWIVEQPAHLELLAAICLAQHIELMLFFCHVCVLFSNGFDELLMPLAREAIHVNFILQVLGWEVKVVMVLGFHPLCAVSHFEQLKVPRKQAWKLGGCSSGCVSKELDVLQLLKAFLISFEGYLKIKNMFNLTQSKKMLRH